MRKRTQKGFTIVELVIVIAVIAILAAVLIPTFASIIDKANNSADTQMVANLNKYLAAVGEIDGKNETMADAMKDAADAGYTAAALASASNTILWDSESDRFIAISEKGKLIAGVDGAEYKEDDAAMYWVVSEEIDATYATYLIGNTFGEGETVTITLGLDLTGWSGNYAKANVTCDGDLTLNGMFNKVTVNKGKTVKVYGYVVELSGNVTSVNAQFHQPKDGDNNVGIWNQVTGSATFSAHIFKDTNNDTECTIAGCTVKYHEHTTQQTELNPATCEADGVIVTKCTQDGCLYTVVEVTEKLGHDFSVVKYDEVAHWKECSRCNKEETDEDGSDIFQAHRTDVTVTGEVYKISCDCGYMLEGNSVPATYIKAIELNQKLTSSSTVHATMHDALLALADSETEDSVKSVIDSIKAAEGEDIIGQSIIVWDQTIDRFVVTKEIYGKAAVVYTPKDKNGLNGYVERDAYLYPLWDTYDILPENGKQSYSVYFTGDSLQDYLFEKNGAPSMYVFACGFDMGFVEFNEKHENQNLTIVQGSKSGSYNMVYRTNGSNCDIYLRGKSNVEHYGQCDTLYYGNGWGNIVYSEYGSLNRIKKDQQQCESVIIIAKSGSTVPNNLQDNRYLTIKDERTTNP